MNQEISNKRSLETFKIFPILAWVLTIAFAIFVYNITTELKTITEDLQEQTRQLQEKVDQNPQEIDFDA